MQIHLISFCEVAAQSPFSLSDHNTKESMITKFSSCLPGNLSPLIPIFFPLHENTILANLANKVTFLIHVKTSSFLYAVH